MKRRVSLVLSIVAVLAVAALAFNANVATTPEASDVSEVLAPTDAGYKVHIDPATGRIIENPVAEDTPLPKNLDNALRTDHEGLVIEDGPLGGKMVNLQGRFQNTYVATIDENGNLTAECDVEHNH